MLLFSEKRGQASALSKEPVPDRPYPTHTTNGAGGDKDDRSHDSRQRTNPHALIRAPLIKSMPSPAERPEPGPTPHHGKPVPFSLRKETRPQLPERALAAVGEQASLYALGHLIIASIAIMPLAFAGVVTSDQSFVALIVIIIAAILPNLAVSLVYGQAGSRLLRHMGAAGELDFDDDALWRLGVFYVNHEDPSVVVPQRFGVGWAMNWGNPRSWGLVALFVAAIAVIVVVIELLV